MSEVTLFIAFFAGILTFLSPCIFPLIPGFISYLAGTSITDNSPGSRRRNLLTSLYFVLGFTLVFTIIGILIGEIFGVYLSNFHRPMQIIGGSLIIFFGLFVTGLIKVPFLEREFKINAHTSKVRYVGAFFFGIAFSIGWTPCMGPILGTIMTIAVTEPQIAMSLMLFFSLGLGIPFLLTGFFANEVLTLIKKSSKFFKYFNIVVGIIMIILGLLLVTGLMHYIALYAMPITFV